MKKLSEIMADAKLPHTEDEHSVEIQVVLVNADTGDLVSTEDDYLQRE